MVIAIIVAFVVVIHVQCLVSVYLSLVKIKYSVCVEKKIHAIDKSTERERRLVVARGWWERGMRNNCLMGTGFPFEAMKEFFWS